MGSWRGSEQTIGQNFKMKLLLALCMLGLASSSQDYKMFMKWAKTKAQESCWGEDNMKVYTVNMKKAVAKCQQSDAPELDLPPFRAANRFVNNLVGMAGEREDERDEMESFMKFMKFTKMMDMMKSHMPQSDSESPMMKMMHMMKKKQEDSYMPYSNEYSKDSSSENMMEKIKMKMMMDSKNNGYEGEYKQKNLPVERMSSAWESISQMRFKRQADDSLALNDRLKEKLVGMMKEHVHKVSNMTCVLRELNVIDYNNNVDLNALKEEYVPKNYNGPLKNLGKIKSFMNCCKSAKMKLC